MRTPSIATPAIEQPAVSAAPATTTPAPVALTPELVVIAPPRRRWPRRALIAVGIVGTILALGYLFYVRPILAAYHRMITRVTAASSLHYTGDLQFYGQDFLAAYDSKMDFNGVVLRPGDAPSVGLINFSGNWAKRDYAGQAQLGNSRLNFRLIGSPMPVIRYKQSTILAPLKSGQAYSLKADSSLWDNVCENRTPASLGSQLELYRQLKALKPSPSWLINRWAQHEGSTVTRFSGQVSPKDMAKTMTAIQQALPAGCDLSTLGFTSQDLNHVAAKFQVWTNATDDWLELKFEDTTLGSRLTLSLHGNRYGEATQEPAPLTPLVNLNAYYTAQVKAVGLIPYGE